MHGGCTHKAKCKRLHHGASLKGAIDSSEKIKGLDQGANLQTRMAVVVKDITSSDKHRSWLSPTSLGDGCGWFEVPKIVLILVATFLTQLHSSTLVEREREKRDACVLARLPIFPQSTGCTFCRCRPLLCGVPPAECWNLSSTSFSRVKLRMKTFEKRLPDVSSGDETYVAVELCRCCVIFLCAICYLIFQLAKPDTANLASTGRQAQTDV